MPLLFLLTHLYPRQRRPYARILSAVVPRLYVSVYFLRRFPTVLSRNFHMHMLSPASTVASLVLPALSGPYEMREVREAGRR